MADEEQATTPCVHDWCHVSGHHWMCRVCSMVSLGSETTWGGSAPPDAKPVQEPTADERAARGRAAQLCATLRARGDSLSLDAAAEIEGTLEAFAGLVADQRRLRERAENAERNHRETLALWSRVPATERHRIVHGRAA